MEQERTFQHRQAAIEHAKAAEWHDKRALDRANAVALIKGPASTIDPGTEEWLKRDILTELEWNFWKEGLRAGDTMSWNYINFKITHELAQRQGRSTEERTGNNEEEATPTTIWATPPMQGGQAPPPNATPPMQGGQAPAPKRQRQQRGGVNVAWHTAKYKARKLGPEALQQFLRENPDPRQPSRV